MEELLCACGGGIWGTIGGQLGGTVGGHSGGQVEDTKGIVLGNCFGCSGKYSGEVFGV